MDEFDEIIDVGATQTLLFATSKNKFGDGYEAVTELGLHPVQEAWNISITDTLTRIQQSMQFLNEHRSVRAFIWISPLGDELVVTAENVRLKGPDEGGLFVLEARFVEELT